MLTDERKKEIDRLIEDLDLHSKSIAEILEENGIFYYEMDFPWGVSGMTSYDPKTKHFSIQIKEDEYGPRKNFTVAHEIGHFFLHQKHLQEKDQDMVSFRKEYVKDLSDEERGMEQEADYFAAQFLMPARAMKKFAKKLMSVGMSDFEVVEQLATAFCVSRSACRIRLKSLRLM